MSIGIYNCYSGMPPEAIPFFKACGYNTYQRWDVAWTKRPENQAKYHAEVADDIRRMKEAGFDIFVVTCLNMRERKAGEPEGFDDLLFDPTDKALVRARLAGIASMARKLAMADGFTVFAGDPGGHPNATPEDLSAMTREVIAAIRREAPRAAVNVNTWGIAAWDHYPSPFTAAFWEKELDPGLPDTQLDHIERPHEQAKPGMVPVLSFQEDVPSPGAGQSACGRDARSSSRNSTGVRILRSGYRAQKSAPSGVSSSIR